MENMRDDLEYIRNLLFEKISGDISSEDDRFIESILMRDRQVREMWFDICQTVNAGKGRRLLNDLDADAAWKHVEMKLDSPKKNPSIVTTQWQWWAAAAVLLIAVGVNYYYMAEGRLSQQSITSSENSVKLQLSNGRTILLDENDGSVIDLNSVKLIPGEEELHFLSKSSSEPEWTSVVVPATRDYKVNLSDDTEVWLNADSRLRFPLNFSDSLREVYLDGEGYFRVAKNTQQPFVVHAGNTTIRVVGTSFNVNAYDTAAVITALVDGLVLARAGVHHVALKPGYQALSAGDSAFTTAPFDADLLLSWMHGSYYFHDQTLTDISRMMRRWFDVKVVFKNDEVAALTFTGTLEKNKPLDVFIRNLELASDVHAKFAGDTLFID